MPVGLGSPAVAAAAGVADAIPAAASSSGTAKILAERAASDRVRIIRLLLVLPETGLGHSTRYEMNRPQTRLLQLGAPRSCGWSG